MSAAACKVVIDGGHSAITNALFTILTDSAERKIIGEKLADEMLNMLRQMELANYDGGLKSPSTLQGMLRELVECRVLDNSIWRLYAP